MERALGISWDLEEDLMRCKITPKLCEATRRNILSIISATYDPLGLVAPFILPARVLLQKLCQKGVEWDFKLDDEDEDRKHWEQWVRDLPRLAECVFCFSQSDGKPFGTWTRVPDFFFFFFCHALHNICCMMRL